MMLRHGYEEAEAQLRALLPALARAESTLGFDEPHRIAAMRAAEAHWSATLSDGGLSRWRTRLLCRCWCGWRDATWRAREAKVEARVARAARHHALQVDDPRGAA